MTLAALIGYIDPGTGAIIAQIVLAGVLTGAVAFRRFLLWPVNFLLGGSGSRKPDVCDRQADGAKASQSQE